MDIQTVTFYIAITGAVTGTIGTILSFINTIRNICLDRIKIKVIPKIAVQLSSTDVIRISIPNSEYEPFIQKYPKRLCVEVINLSTFPVSIQEVGFGTPNIKAGRHVIIKPRVVPQDVWPVRLGTHEGTTLYGDIDALDLNTDIVHNKKAYVETACGKIFLGTSPVFKEHLEKLKNKKTKGC